jgi:hypothetical protein
MKPAAAPAIARLTTIPVMIPISAPRDRPVSGVAVLFCCVELLPVGGGVGADDVDAMEVDNEPSVIEVVVENGFYMPEPKPKF